ncbi:hypothetical protein ES708_23651 [subsurface metagenome]
MENPPVKSDAPGASLFVPFTLAPGAEKTINLCFSWYVPVSDLRIGNDPVVADPGGAGLCCSGTYKPWYSGKFASIKEVAGYWRNEYHDLRGKTELFKEAFFDTNIPGEVVEAIAANLTILKSPTVMRQTDGKLWCWEGCCDSWGCCHGSCTHVWNYAQAIPHLFPKLERTLRQTEFNESQNEEGHQTFRASLPIRPVKHNFHAASDGQLGHNSRHVYTIRDNNPSYHSNPPNKIESAIKMFWRAISQGIKVDYVLMDSWFTCAKFISAVRKVKKQTVHLIGMYKIPRTKFGYSNQQLTYSQIRNILGKAKRCRKLRLYYKEAIVDYNGQPLKMFFSRQGKNGKWRVFITTDIELFFIRMIEIYQIRWSIEVFFKEAKQLLGLGKCQSNDFDAQIADTTITMVQHILLTLKYRFEHYESKGALFEQVREGIVQSRLNERLWGLFIELLRLIDVLFDGIDEMEILERVLNDEKAYEMINRLLQNDFDMKNAA